jgi:signal transduction histidine kinase
MGKPTENQAGAPRAKRALVPIRAKLAAALLVPLVAVVALSLVQVNQAQDRQTTVEEETKLAGVALAPGGLTDALIVEQGDAVVTVLGMRETATFPTQSIEESMADTDAALEDLKQSVEQGGPVARRIFANALADIESNLADQRAKIADGMAAPGLENWDLTESMYPAYGQAIEALRKANGEVAASITDPEMRAAAETLNDVNVAHYAVSNLIKQTGTALASPDPLVKYEVAGTLRDYEQAVTSLRSRNQGDWAEAVTAYAANPNYDQIASMVQQWLATGDLVLEDLIALNPAVSNRSEAQMGTTQRIAQDASASLEGMIDQRTSDAEAEAQRYRMIAAAVIIGATVAALAVAASILRPMRKLTRQAEEMASVGLPAAVQGVLDTPPHEDVVIPQLAPISVRSHDEVQTVAAALNHVQTSALDLAVEQATLRRHIADSFVSLGRRTQNLIGLQLELITELEESETDPAVLESLYRLDHLATRARRNAESLVVLGGTEAQRTSGLPVAMTDVVRATLSEVEAYQRVALQHLDLAYVPASSAADLIHLLAELVENGLSFSPPTSEVEVSGSRGPGGYTITVTDHGVGMTADRLATANRRLSGNESFTVAPSRYLGHYVAGRLAARLGASVSLAAGSGGGVVATVTVPTAGLISDADATRALAQADQTAGPNGNGTDHDGVHADPDNAEVKVDGRPPLVAPVAAGSNGHGSADGDGLSPAAEAPRLPAVAERTTPADEPAAEPAAEAVDETTSGGLRKRVPGSHVKAANERSPLLRSAAANAERTPLKAGTSPQEAQNLAALLTDYTAGVDRGRGDLTEAGAEPAE